MNELSLQDIALFGGLSERATGFLQARARHHEFARGETIFTEGEPGNSMFILLSGEIAILKKWNGQQYRICELKPGDCFGEMSIIDMNNRSASILAVCPVTAMEISADHLYALYRENLPEFTLLQMNMAREVSRRLRQAQAQLFEQQHRYSQDLDIDEDQTLLHSLQILSDQPPDPKASPQ